MLEPVRDRLDPHLPGILLIDSVVRIVSVVRRPVVTIIVLSDLIVGVRRGGSVSGTTRNRTAHRPAGELEVCASLHGPRESLTVINPIQRVSER